MHPTFLLAFFQHLLISVRSPKRHLQLLSCQLPLAKSVCDCEIRGKTRKCLISNKEQMAFQAVKKPKKISVSASLAAWRCLKPLPNVVNAAFYDNYCIRITAFFDNCISEQVAAMTFAVFVWYFRFLFSFSFFRKKTNLPKILFRLEIVYKKQMILCAY